MTPQDNLLQPQAAAQNIMEPNKQRDEMAFTLQKSSKGRQGLIELVAVSNLMSENFPNTCKSVGIPWWFWGFFSCVLAVWGFFWSWLLCFIFKNTFHITKVSNISACTRQINTGAMDEMNWHVNNYVMLGNRQNGFRKKNFCMMHLLEILLMVH